MRAITYFECTLQSYRDWLIDKQTVFPQVITTMHLLKQVLNVLKRISDEDCLLLGLNPKYARPDWMILQVLPIPPPPVRPSVMMDTSARSEVKKNCC
jgi:DNA-directed RNA polymerase II subunit RPB1